MEVLGVGYRIFGALRVIVNGWGLGCSGEAVGMMGSY
jgi:hypothetical protein